MLPLGYSFNLDGTMAYTTFATMFIAQAYGIDMPIGAAIGDGGDADDYVKGVAGVPRASLVVILATLAPASPRPDCCSFSASTNSSTWGAARPM